MKRMLSIGTMNDPSLSRRKTPYIAKESKKLKLVLSFNGAFHLRQSAGKLIYVGGETRIVSFDRNAGFSRLRSKISDLCPNISSFSLMCQLSDRKPSPSKPLLLIDSEDDFRCLIDEYDAFMLYDKYARLRVFVCRKNIVSCDVEGQNSMNADCGVRSRNDSLRKLALKHQPRTKQSVDSVLPSYTRTHSETNVGPGGKQNCIHPLIDICPGEHFPNSGNVANHNFDDRFPGACRNLGEIHSQGGENYGNLASCAHPLNPRDGNLRVEAKKSTHCLSKQRNRVLSCIETNLNVGISRHPVTRTEQNRRRIRQASVKGSSRENIVPQTANYDSAADLGEACNAKSCFCSNRTLSDGKSGGDDFGGVNAKDQADNLNDQSTLTGFVVNCNLPDGRVEPIPEFSSYASEVLSKPLQKPQAKCRRLMGEEQVSDQLGLKSTPSLLNVDLKIGRVDEDEVENIQDPKSTLSFDETAEAKEKRKFSSVSRGISSDLLEFYTHLATRELQSINKCDLEYIKELSSGTYGTVFYGKWKGSDVAIKKIKSSCFNGGLLEEDQLIADFWKEAYLLGQLHHPNIVGFYGVVTDGPATNFATVTEYMVNGSLKQVLRRKDRTIDRRKRLIIAMDAAVGMEYLHEKNIVHFDLKSRNLLVNMRDPKRPICKVGDLGLSKIKHRTLVSGSLRGTIPWMAPELLNSNNNLVTEKVDVYSFGIVMWELLTGEEPYSNLRSEEVIAGLIRENLRPEIPSWCDPSWRFLMQKCWSNSPEDRLSFSEIVKELRSMSEAMNIKLPM